MFFAVYLSYFKIASGSQSDGRVVNILYYLEFIFTSLYTKVYVYNNTAKLDQQLLKRRLNTTDFLLFYKKITLVSYTFSPLVWAHVDRDCTFSIPVLFQLFYSSLCSMRSLIAGILSI